MALHRKRGWQLLRRHARGQSPSEKYPKMDHEDDRTSWSTSRERWEWIAELVVGIFFRDHFTPLASSAAPWAETASKIRYGQAGRGNWKKWRFSGP